MFDETTEIATLQQYLTFVQYIDTVGCQATAFLDIRRIDAHGVTAANLRVVTRGERVYDPRAPNHCRAGLQNRSRSRKGSEVSGWSRSRIPSDTGSRSRIFLSDSGCPTRSFFTSHC